MSSPPPAETGESASAHLLNALLPVIAEIGAVRETDELFPAIARQLRRLLPRLKVLDIFLPAGDGGNLAPAYAEGYAAGESPRRLVRPGEGIVGSAAVSREPIFVPDVSSDPRYIPVAAGVRAELALPLVHGDRMVGVLNVEGPDPEAFHAEALIALQVLARHLAVAIENAQLYDELFRRDERLHRQLSLARDVQHGLFPEGSPRGEGWEASAHFLPAEELGGDLYDFYDLGEGRLGLAVGDVSGKGVSAALYGAFTSGAVRARAFERRTPSDLLESVNRTLRRRGREGFFCTMVYALFDFPRRELRLAGSGLPYPLHYRPSVGRCVPLEVAGIPLGALDGSRYDELAVALEPGDVLVFHSDGLTEAWRDGEDYGRHRLSGRVEQAGGRLSAREVGETVLADVREFLGEARLGDDLTLVVVKLL